MRLSKKSMVGAALMASAFVLSACQAEEQGRVINYEPGVYKGKADTRLTSLQVSTLRGRMSHQFAQSGNTGGATWKSSAPGTSVRLPATAVNVRVLENRARYQSDRP